MTVSTENDAYLEPEVELRIRLGKIRGLGRGETLRQRGSRLDGDRGSICGVFSK